MSCVDIWRRSIRAERTAGPWLQGSRMILGVRVSRWLNWKGRGEMVVVYGQRVHRGQVV